MKAKVAAERIAEFERRCARGQLLAAVGNFAQAGEELISALRDFAYLYPDNGHAFTHFLQLALALQLTEVVSIFLSDRYKAPGVFVVAPCDDVEDPVVNQVTVDDAGRCHFPVRFRIVCLQHADFFVSRWLGGAVPWAHFCTTSGWLPGSIMINTGEDGCTAGLAFCGNRPEHILIPDNHFLGSRGYAELRATYKAGRAVWHDRRPVAFWRGATTGIRTGGMGWESLPRVKLCRLSQASSEVLDAGISEIVQCSAQDREAIEAARLTKGSVRPIEFLKYKYQIDIGGNSNSWPGFYQKLLTGSPVLKVASPHGYRQWYYDRLRPWIHFVPVEADLSDLLMKIDWLRTHDDDARAIGEAGQAFAESLEHDKELAFSSRQIRAAFCAQRAEPELIHHYGVGGDDGETLAYGWDLPSQTPVWALGSQSVIRLPRLAMPTAYEVKLDLEPHIFVPDVPAQQVIVAANGKIVGVFSLSDRQTITFLVPKLMIMDTQTIEITLLHPDAFAPCCYLSRRDDRDLSVAIHCMHITSIKE